MKSNSHKVSGVKVLNISEENPKAIEKMVDAAIKEIEGKGEAILDIKITHDNIFFVLGEPQPNAT